MIVKIADESSEFVTQLLEKLGADVTLKKTSIRKRLSAVNKTAKKGKQQRKISPTFLFGKWKDLSIDAKKIRNEAWDRSHKYL